MREFVIPPPEAGDGEDVHWALTTAASLQASGDYPEALRWLRRAVAAALASSHDGRAIELGRCAAELEDALAGAPTDRGHQRDTMPEEMPAAINNTMRIDSRPVPIDGLDEVTYVDGMDEITHVPYTQKAEAIPVRSTPLPAVRSTMPEGRLITAESPAYTLEEDTTVAMKGAPSSHQTIESPSPLTNVPTTSPSNTRPSQPEPRRVALLMGADGDARVIPLPPGALAPDGSAVALLFPVTKQDAQRIAHILGSNSRRNR